MPTPVNPPEVEDQVTPPYLLKGNETRLQVERMPEGAGPLDAPLVIYEQSVAVRDHSLILPVVFSGALDAYAITVSY